MMINVHSQHVDRFVSFGERMVQKLEMLSSIVLCLGSVNLQHVCSLYKFIFTYLQS